MYIFEPSNQEGVNLLPIFIPSPKFKFCDNGSL